MKEPIAMDKMRMKHRKILKDTTTHTKYNTNRMKYTK
jgi:hypothetical protein